MMSPSGDSILITSAPRSPRICVAKGPSTTVVRSRILIPASGPGFVSLTSAPPRRDLALRWPQDWRHFSPEGGEDARDDVSQPALQHLAQDPGAIARKGCRAGDCRVSENALYGGSAEAASQSIEDAGERACPEEGSRRRRH